MWSINPAYGDVIASAWTSANSDAAVNNLVTKIQCCAKKLLRWNKEEFDHVTWEDSKIRRKA